MFTFLQSCEFIKYFILNSEIGKWDARHWNLAQFCSTFNAIYINNSIWNDYRKIFWCESGPDLWVFTFLQSCEFIRHFILNSKIEKCEARHWNLGEFRSTFNAICINKSIQSVNQKIFWCRWGPDLLVFKFLQPYEFMKYFILNPKIGKCDARHWNLSKFISTFNAICINCMPSMLHLNFFMHRTGSGQ